MRVCSFAWLCSAAACCSCRRSGSVHFRSWWHLTHELRHVDEVRLQQAPHDRLSVIPLPPAASFAAVASSSSSGP